MVAVLLQRAHLHKFTKSVSLRTNSIICHKILIHLTQLANSCQPLRNRQRKLDDEVGITHNKEKEEEAGDSDIERGAKRNKNEGLKQGLKPNWKKSFLLLPLRLKCTNGTCMPIGLVALDKR